MRLTVVDAISEPGGNNLNEDAFGHARNSAWVLDGATGLGDDQLLPGPSDAAWLVKAYGRLLLDCADRDVEVEQLLRELINNVTQQFAAEQVRTAEQHFQLPSAGLILVRLRHQRLELIQLGDCKSILLIGGERASLVSTRRSLLQDLDAQATDKLAEALSDRSLSFSTARRSIDPDLRANRSRMNEPGGYWVLGFNPDAARFSEQAVLDLHPDYGAKGLLVSDGFYRLVDTFNAYPHDGALLNAALAKGLAPLLAELREIEAADPDCRAHPRFKPRDDATALLFEVQGAVVHGSARAPV